MREYHPSDLLTTVIARHLGGVESCFHGLASTVPMVAIMLARKLYYPGLLYLNITGGVNVKDVPLRISSDGPNLYHASQSAFNLTDIFDFAARGALDVAFLSGGQVDEQGRVNNSAIGPFASPKVKLPGGAGSAVLIPNAKRSFIWKSKHEPRGLVKEVDFVTSKGNVDYIFTPLCVFKRIDGRMMLAGVMPGSSLEEIRENTGFEVGVHSTQAIAPPTEEELRLLGEIDPLRARDAEF